MISKSPNLHYTCHEVGLSGQRPFRVCTTHWDKEGLNVLPGDDPDAALDSSRALILYATTVDQNGTIVPLHTHDFFEIAFVRHSSGNQHVTEKGKRLLQRGKVIVITPGASHGYEPIYGLHKTDLYLQPTWLSHELRLLWREMGLIRMLLAYSLFEWKHLEGLWEIDLTEEELCICEMDLDFIIEEARASQPSLALFSGCFLKLLAIINKAYMRNHQPGDIPAPQMWDVVVRVDRMIENGEILNIDQLAENCNISRRNMDRLFTRDTGLSIMQHYRNRRLQHAARLLTEPTYTIKEIAYYLNYADTAHFVRSFKDKMGVTPGEYRNQHERMNT